MSEELIGDGSHTPEALIDALIDALRQHHGPLRVLTLHAEVEGGPFLSLLERLLTRLKDSGGLGEIVTMASAAARLRDQLPVRQWCMVRLPGRAFTVSSSRAEPV